MGKSATSSLRDLAWFLSVMALLIGAVLSVPTLSASEHPVRVSVFAVGFLCELAGLTMAIVGFGRTWRDNVPRGGVMYPGLPRLVDKVLRRRPPMASPAAGGVVSGAGLVNPSLVERIARLEDELSRTREALSQVRPALEEQTRARVRDIAGVRADGAGRAEEARRTAVQLDGMR